VGDPAVEIALGHRQRARRDAGTTGDMAEVGAGAAARRRAGDRMALRALPRRDVTKSGERERLRWWRRGLQLALAPRKEIGDAVDDDDERHVRVLRAAEFGALAAEDADLVGNERHISLTTGDEVL